MIKCQVPNSCLVINPNGSLAPCCQATKPFEDGSRELMLRDYEDIPTFFNGDFLQSIRQKISTSGKHPQFCNECLAQHASGERTFMDIIDDTLPDSLNEKYNIKGNELKYLEITTSNICNQTCTTCNGWFSSAWNILDRSLKKKYPGIEHELSVENVSRHWIINKERLQSSEIDKIKKALPEIHVLCLKGGEPFADKRNIEILDHLALVNPECYVQIITNFTLVDKHIKTLKKIKNLDVDASVDGIYDQYEWIRSSKWNKLLEQMDIYTNELNRQTRVNVTVSLYNYTNLYDIIHYWNNSSYIKSMSATNIVHHPKISSYKLLKQQYLDFFYDKINMGEGIVISRPSSFTDIDREYYLNKALRWITVMDGVRGFKLTSCVPSLNMLDEMVL